MVDVYGGRGPTVEAVTWSLFAICTVLLALRLYVKIGMKRPGGLALTWALIAYVSTPLLPNRYRALADIISGRESYDSDRCNHWNSKIWSRQSVHLSTMLSTSAILNNIAQIMVLSSKRPGSLERQSYSSGYLPPSDCWLSALARSQPSCL